VVKSNITVDVFEDQISSIFGSTVGTYDELTQAKSVVYTEEEFTLRLTIFATASDSRGDRDNNEGRPNIRFFIDNFVTSSCFEESTSKSHSYNCCLLLCGPKSLVNEASTYSAKKNIHCHTETFNY
jgi:hypothetical protein